MKPYDLCDLCYFELHLSSFQVVVLTMSTIVTGECLGNGPRAQRQAGRIKENNDFTSKQEYGRNTHSDKIKN